MFAKSNSKTSSPGTAFQPDYRLSTSYRRKPSSLPWRARKSRAALGLPILLHSPAFGKDTIQICSREGQGPGPHLPLRTRATTSPPHLCPEHTPQTRTQRADPSQALSHSRRLPPGSLPTPRQAHLHSFLNSEGHTPLLRCKLRDAPPSSNTPPPNT